MASESAGRSDLGMGEGQAIPPAASQLAPLTRHIRLYGHANTEGRDIPERDDGELAEMR